MRKYVILIFLLVVALCAYADNARVDPGFDSGALRKTGGTLTGALNGTSADFSGTVDANNLTMNGGQVASLGANTFTDDQQMNASATIDGNIQVDGEGIFGGAADAGTFALQVTGNGYVSSALLVATSTDNSSYNLQAVGPSVFRSTAGPQFFVDFLPLNNSGSIRVREAGGATGEMQFTLNAPNGNEKILLRSGGNNIFDVPEVHIGSGVTDIGAYTLQLNGDMISNGNQILGDGYTGWQTAKDAAGIVNGAYMDLPLPPVGFCGILSVYASENADANNRSFATYSIMGRQGTASAITLITSSSAGGASPFSVTVPAAGVCRITNDDTQTAHISASFNGTGGS